MPSRPLAAALLGLALVLPACRERAVGWAPDASAEAPPPAHAPSPADRRTDRGWRTVDPTLPHLRHDEERETWIFDGAPLPDLASVIGRRVLLEGKMVLGDSSPYRALFVLSPHYDGCVDISEREHRRLWIDVRMPEGESVQVTDAPLLVEGALESVTPGAPPVFAAVRVQPTDRPPGVMAPRH